MAKGGKSSSSATAATRKKHARKAAGPLQIDEPLEKQKKFKTKDKGKKKEPRQKIYIPPVKPPPLQPDPLDTMGLAHLLPPDLLVVLRKLGKKSTQTKINSLEELQSGWVDKCKKRGDDDSLSSTLVLMLPVWLHHVSALFMNPSHRVRLSTASLQFSLLHIPEVRDQMSFFLRNTASLYQCEYILGTWYVAAHIDRQVSSHAIKSWNDAFSLVDAEQSGKLLPPETLIARLQSFVQKGLLDPSGVYSYLNPTQPVIAPTPPKKASGRSNLPQKRDSTDSVSWSKIEEEEESEQDRNARIRIGSFGAIGWILDKRVDGPHSASVKELMDFLSNPAVWTSLHFDQTSPIAQMDNFGYGQPLVRRSAWSVLQSLLRNWKGTIEPLLSTLSSAVLRSAWVEPDATVRGVMWQPLLSFLREFPNAWDIDLASQSGHNDEEDPDTDDDVSDRGTAANPQILPLVEIPRKSLAYQEFLQFLELGCSGSPRDGYPTVVIILSTIPSQILASSPSSPPILDFFTSFWAAVDGRALSSLERATTSAAFLSSLLECLVFLVKRIRKGAKGHAELLLGNPPEENTQAGQDERLKNLINDQFRRAWDGMVSRQLRAEESAAGKLVAQTLVSLNDIDEDLFRAAWSTLSVLILDQACSAQSGSSILAPVFLETFSQVFGEGTTPWIATHSLIGDISHTSLNQCEVVLGVEESDVLAITNGVIPLVNILNTFGAVLFDDTEFSARVDQLLTINAYRLLSASPSLLLAYFSHRQDQDRTLELWHALLSGTSQQSTFSQEVFLPLLDAARKGLLPSYLRPRANELDVMVGKLLEGVLRSPTSSPQMDPLCQLLRTAQYFLSDTSFHAQLQSINSAFSLQVDHALHNSTTSLSSFEVLLDLMETVIERWPQLTFTAGVTMVPLVDVFILAYLLPKCCDCSDSRSVSVAQNLWARWLVEGSADCFANVIEEIKARLRALIADTQARPRPEDVWQMISDGCPGIGIMLINDIFISCDRLDKSLDDLSPEPISPGLAVLEPLIPPAPMFKNKHVLSPGCDDRGYSSYARVVSGLLQVFIQDRQTAKNNMWALRHFLALELYASDLLSVPYARSPVFNERASGAGLSALISKIQQVTTYLLTSSPDDGWRSKVLFAVMDNKIVDSSENLAHFLADLLKRVIGTDNLRECRILRLVLQHILDKVEKEEADHWILLARKFEKTAPQTCTAIITSVTKYAPEPPRLDRYRNELAASMLGITTSKADTEGLLVLQRLAATAPDPDSTIVFLSQQRAVNVMKACQQWIASDDDISEEVESAMTLIFFHLAPILQNVPGSHWDFIFDMIETNLENCSFADDTTLATLARTFRLIGTIQNLASGTKSLRNDWQARQASVLTSVKNLVAMRLDNVDSSVPRSTCRALALTIIQDIPVALLDQTTMSSICHLLTDSFGTVQQMAYQLSKQAAQKRTEYLVLEAAVDTEGTFKTELPTELLEILQRTFDEDDLDRGGQEVFGYLLGWMIVFDSFTNASLKVRSSYVDQLRNLDIIAAHFIPTVLGLLKLYDGIAKAFRLDIWAVGEYYVQFCDPGSLLSCQLLAAHLYYRSLLTVPSLIRTWVLDRKDRQLFASVTSYTTQHFSQVLIETELAHVKNATSVAELVDEHMAIKVANAVNEVTASYLVDEHQLEMTLKMPADWPLHPIEIKESKRIGVLEKRWRAWELGVQQTISAHNGHIADGFSLFKKNVTLHFAGQVECPICYSIISVSEGALPKPACKTCKNRFHSSCLYKWFESSHSSSCPICRSNII